jgi:glycosyltransferase involved in cell wall biosynthesis
VKLAVVAPEAVPFAVGGAERLCDGLVAAFAEHGHDCELVKIPSPERSFWQLVDSYQAFARLDLSAFDLIVSTKYPSWMVRHPRHQVYMLHTLRGLYDSYHGFGQPTQVLDPSPPVRRLLRVLQTPPGTSQGWQDVLGTARDTLESLGDDDPALIFPGALIRRLVHWLDRDALDPSNIAGYAAISRTVAQRKGYFPSRAHVEVLLPPTNMTELHTGRYDNFFTASRLDQPKRIDMLIEAMRYVEGPVQLRIAGTGPEEARLRGLRPEDERIVFLGRISDEALIDEYANALAVPFIPVDEDFGLVTLEAQLAGKAVVTCDDSGGVTELVTDMVNGRVVPPDPRALGQALQELTRSKPQARMMGAAGRRAAQQVSWDSVVGALLEPSSGPDGVGRGGDRKKIVVLSTYPAHPAQHGGQIRLNRLIRGLAQRFEVELVTADHGLDSTQVSYPYPGVRQSIAATGQDYRELEARLAAQAPVPVGDIAASLFAHHSAEFVRVLREATRGAVGAVLEQPYLLPLLSRVAPSLPYAYDSQNAEVVMKSALFSGLDGADALLQVVRTVEATAVAGAELVGVCSTQDRDQLAALSPTLADWILVPNGTDALDSIFITGSQRATNSRRWLAQFYAGSPEVTVERLAIFVGSYHPPNLEAAEFIVRLAPRLPDVCFALVGRQGLYFDNWVLPPNVIVTGLVGEPELDRLLASADVALNPIRSGGGTNLKLIEYFAAGVPVVSTPLGTRGTALRDDVELLVRDLDGFANGIRCVLDDPAGAQNRAERARALAELGYDWEPIGSAFAAAVETAFVGTPLLSIE